MRAIPADPPGVVILEPRVFGDARGFFMETWNARTFADLGIDVAFVQDNHSKSGRGILRGLHYQIEQAQGKLVRAIAGEIFDAAVDIRRSSPHFGRHTAVILSEENKRQVYIPPGFAHGFLVLSETAEVIYKVTDYWAPEHERTLIWNDPRLGIKWPLAPGEKPILSDKDARGVRLADAEVYS
jgi:dTDP-4-dehydrorhamnose 3,5-epimerase